MRSFILRNDTQLLQWGIPHARLVTTPFIIDLMRSIIGANHPEYWPNVFEIHPTHVHGNVFHLLAELMCANLIAQRAHVWFVLWILAGPDGACAHGCRSLANDGIYLQSKMKRARKGAPPLSVSPLRLHCVIPQRDVRKLIWQYLNHLDREMVRCAQNAARTPSLGYHETQVLVLNNYASIAAWLLLPAASREAVLYWSQVLDMCIYIVRPEVFAAVHAVIGRGWKSHSYIVLEFALEHNLMEVVRNEIRNIYAMTCHGAGCHACLNCIFALATTDAQRKELRQLMGI
jgi:hypothetical protein